MKQNERKKHFPALVLMLLILCALLIGAEATTIPDKTALPNAQEIVTNLRIIRNASMENGDIPQENNGWMGGDPSCEHLHISWVSDGNLRHHAVCDDCGAESPERAHTAQCFFKTNLTHRMECNLCRQALGEEKPHIIRYLSDGVKEHTIVCSLCGMAISEPHKLVCVNDDEKGHHWQCTDCGEITATDSHRLIPRYVSDGHCFACKDCSYISDVEPCTYVAVSQGEKGHVWKCSVCSATTGNVEPHHLKWIGDGLTGHHEECLDCGYAAPKVLHDWVAVSRGLKGHGLECPTCGEVTEQMESHTWVGVSRGLKNHVLKCSECGETTSQTEAHYWTVVQNGVTGHSLECVVCGETSEQTPHDWTLVNEGQAGHRGVCETCQYTTQLLPHMLLSTEDGVSCACGYKESKPSKPDQGNEPVQVEIPGPGKSEESGGVVAEKPEDQQDQNDKTSSGKQVIGEKQYIYDLKKVTGEDTDGGETLKDGESVTIGIRNDQSAKVLIQAEKDGTSITGLEPLMLDVTDVSKLFIETEGEKTGAVDSQDAGSSSETEFTEEQGGTTVLEPGMKYAWSKSSGDQDAAYQMTISRNEGQTEVDYRRIRKSYKKAMKARKKARMKVKESKTVLKPESVVEKDGKTVYGLEQKSKRKLSTRRSWTKRLKEISDKIVPYSQVYIQENRSSGR